MVVTVMYCGIAAFGVLPGGRAVLETVTWTIVIAELKVRIFGSEEVEDEEDEEVVVLGALGWT